MRKRNNKNKKIFTSKSKNDLKISSLTSLATKSVLYGSPVTFGSLLGSSVQPEKNNNLFPF